MTLSFRRRFAAGPLAMASLLLAACGGSGTTTTQTPSGTTADVPLGGRLSIASWNVENLFDTVDDPATDDSEWLSGLANGWSEERLGAKLHSLAEVIRQMNRRQGPDLLGLVEVENAAVVRRLADSLGSLGPFGIVHRESPDERGIDVALIYRSDRLTPTRIAVRRVALPNPTRDVLGVEFTVKGGGEPVYAVINHWPSRRGGADADGFRMTAAATTRALVDSVLAARPGAAVVVMGDFNANPTDGAVTTALQATADSAAVMAPSSRALFNPLAVRWDSTGYGSYTYRGKWEMIDQICLSGGTLRPNGGWRYAPGSVAVFSLPSMRTPDGPYAGTPFHTYSGSHYLGGQSDHWPVAVQLVRRR